MHSSFVKWSPFACILATIALSGCEKKDETRPDQEQQAPEERTVVAPPEHNEPMMKEQQVAVAHAELKNAKGQVVGRAEFRPTKEGVTLRFSGEGLPPGTHGFHIHEKGACEPPTFESAGGHMNPENKAHGLEDPEGAHAGDMPNLEVPQEGQVEMTHQLDDVTLEVDGGDNSLLRNGGTALVIHAKRDDQKTDPAGDAGSRIACGVITKGETS